MPKKRNNQPKAARLRTGRQALSARGSPHNAEDLTIVGIGASAGGLDACKKLVGGLHADNGMAFILIQHLDPTHESMMVDLLASCTTMTVRQATEGMPVERDHLYIIPPGTYLSVANGALHLSQPQVRHGTRLPFDFLLHSLAEAYGARAVCVILSGTGADGSLGLKAVKEKGGLVIAQDPDEAGFDGMPRSAIATGAVDLVLASAKISGALATLGRRPANVRTSNVAHAKDTAPEWLPQIIDLLRTMTVHDFTLYKPGTLQRRVERRAALVAAGPDDMDRYLDLLRGDTGELDLLANDLLINVTSFFRDPKVFDLLAEKIIPDLVRGHASDQPLRVWIAGCSTGEESYSIAMLFREQITAATGSIKLQFFASDADADAIATAREGLYPESIAADVSPGRLARFFTKEGLFYRVSPELRASVVFTVQNLLADPPFSRLDLVSCRNLLIYLRPEAQVKAISLFKFALRKGGILLLGSSETVGNLDRSFTAISKSERIYRNVGHNRPEDIGFSIGVSGRSLPRSGQGQALSHQATLADICQQLVIETYAPAAILIDHKHQCLFSLGPTDRYLRVPPGAPTQDLLHMVDADVRTRLRLAIKQARKKNSRIAVASAGKSRDEKARPFGIAVQPVPREGEDLILVCFVDEPLPEPGKRRSAPAKDGSRVAELEQELAAVRTELQGAIRDLEISGEEQQTINEEALSVNEEYQSTNEELETSKEELQSLNEELTALNCQLQETLELKRLTSNDLKNVLYSTDVATVFLDPGLNIRLFTPAVKLLFNVLPSDIGRPLADLSSLANDASLLKDARTVLRTHAPMEREIEAHTGAWYMRRIMPYRTQDDMIEGVVITFSNVTDRRHAADTLEAANRQAQLASLAKSRFLAAASHDLRQPLQTLVLLQGLLKKAVEGEKARRLASRLDETVGAMASMLNTLLDINQIDAGTVRAERVVFPINDILGRLRDEFTYHAQAQRLDLRVVTCGLSIHSDPRLLEQMIRNLLSNALKYTKRGKVLLGCRRRKEMLSIEIWDTGTGIPDNELQAIFDEYHQLDNAARERSRGLGLGLSIVRRLGNLLGHRVSVRSKPGKGSVFTIEVALLSDKTVDEPEIDSSLAIDNIAGGVRRTGSILVIEDDPEVRDLLDLLLTDEGYHTETAPDGVAALELVAHGTIQPDLILADYNLPNGLDGLQVTAKIREKLYRQIPVVILTGDISTATLRDIARQNCVRLSKPVKLNELTQAIQRLLPVQQPVAHPPAQRPVEADSVPGQTVIFVVDDDSHIRDGMRSMLEGGSRIVKTYATGEAFFDGYRPGSGGCLLVDAYLPGMNGLELLQRLNDAGHRLPAIMITGYGDIPMAVRAMKAGALDFIEKPVGLADLLASVERALDLSRDASKLSAWREDAAHHLAGLTLRQHQIMDLVLAGQPNKNIAADLGISRRTVENHRAAIMKKTDSKSLPALARLALAADWNGPE